MKIFTDYPLVWEQLEEQTAAYLNMCGFKAERKFSLKGVRGGNEIDVFAIKQGIPKLKVLCECKLWNSEIPQAVALSFRSIVSDTGANIGYIISKKGFQKGTYAVTDFTNIELLTWEAFQELYLEEYLKNHFYPKLKENVDAIISYTEPIAPTFLFVRGVIKEENREAFQNLFDKYHDFSFLCIHYYQQIYSTNSNGFLILKLPLSKYFDAKNLSDIPKELINVESYEEFLIVAKSIADEGLSEFRKLKANS